MASICAGADSKLGSVCRPRVHADGHVNDCMHACARGGGGHGWAGPSLRRALLHGGTNLQRHLVDVEVGHPLRVAGVQVEPQVGEDPSRARVPHRQDRRDALVRQPPARVWITARFRGGVLPVAVHGVHDARRCRCGRHLPQLLGCPQQLWGPGHAGAVVADLILPEFPPANLAGCSFGRQRAITSWRTAVKAASDCGPVEGRPPRALCHGPPFEGVRAACDLGWVPRGCSGRCLVCMCMCMAVCMIRGGGCMRSCTRPGCKCVAAKKQHDDARGGGHHERHPGARVRSRPRARPAHRGCC